MIQRNNRILLVEDEAGLVFTLTDLLKAEGYEVIACADAEAAELKLASANPDLILLDVMLPGKSGLDLLRSLRSAGNTIPVLMLTARATPPERVVGLKLGADDYLPKPFDSLELLARIEALLRRSEGHGLANGGGSILGFGDITINPERSEVSRAGQVLPLTLQEYRLLIFMVTHPGKTLSRERLLEEVWGYGSNAASRTIDVHVSSLRQKVEDEPAHPAHIITVRGFGYRFEP
ncbi:MAG: response regulator transcription factor [Spirochaetes bacterium]|nr:response regulator transcription factor [Spirochaetota bacterium]